MGVDLTLMPLIGQDFWVSHDMLSLNRRSALWPEINKLQQQEIPRPITCFRAIGEDGEACYGERDDDPYGATLKWTTPRELLTLKDHEAITDDWQNRAVWAYLKQMPPDWPIVLYWS